MGGAGEAASEGSVGGERCVCGLLWADGVGKGRRGRERQMMISKKEKEEGGVIG